MTTITTTGYYVSRLAGHTLASTKTYEEALSVAKTFDFATRIIPFIHTEMRF